MKELGTELSNRWQAGDTVLFTGDLGAGKTTLIRGILAGLGWKGAVRSPTFTLLNPYDTNPPVLHADLYRLTHAEGIGLDDFLHQYLCLIEWPDRLGHLVEPEKCTRITIEPDGEGRRVQVLMPRAGR